MASYAPLYHSIWEDPDFAARSPAAKLLYLQLMSHRKLSRCGLLDLMPARWARSTGLDVVEVDDALEELARHRYVLIDETTEELVVRSKVKNDLPGSWTQVKSVWRAWEQIESPALRDALLLSMPDECWAHPEKAPAPCERPSDTPTQGVPDTPSHTPTEGVGDTPGRVTALSTHTHTPHSAPPPSSSESATTDSTPPGPVDDDQAITDQIHALAEADLARREAEKGPVGNPQAWLRSAVAGHRKRLEADPDYLHHALTRTSPAPSPVDGTIAASLARMQANAARQADAPPRDPQTLAHGIAQARAATRTETP